MNIDGFYVELLPFVLQLDNSFLLSLNPLEVFGNFLTNHAGDLPSISPSFLCRFRLPFFGLDESRNFVSKSFVGGGRVGVRGEVLSYVGMALEGVAGVGALLLNGDKVVLEFVLDELLVVENEAEVFLGIVV